VGDGRSAAQPACPPFASAGRIFCRSRKLGIIQAVFFNEFSGGVPRLATSEGCLSFLSADRRAGWFAAAVGDREFPSIDRMG
jgi:hypothetical protein